MGFVRCLVVLIVVGATVPAVAVADPPWGAPVGVDGISSVTTLLTTQIGGRVLVGMSASRSLAPPSVVARVTRDGSMSHVQTLDIAFARSASFGRAGIVVAGPRPGLSSQAAQQAPVLVALGSVRGIHGVGAPRTLPGTRGQWVLALAGNPANGTIALVTGSMYDAGPPTQTLWVRRGRTFRRTLTVRPGTRSREAAVAIGARGDVLFAWQARREIRARYVGRRGHVGVLVGPQRVAASVRPPGAAAFGAPELVSEPVADGAGRPATEVVTPPGAAVDPRDGQALAVWVTLDQHAKIAVRAGG